MLTKRKIVKGKEMGITLDDLDGVYTHFEKA